MTSKKGRKVEREWWIISHQLNFKQLLKKRIILNKGGLKKREKTEFRMKRTAQTGSHGAKDGLCVLLLAGASCQTIERVRLAVEFTLFDGRAW